MESALLNDCSQLRNIGRPGYEYLSKAEMLNESNQDQEDLSAEYTSNGYYSKTPEPTPCPGSHQTEKPNGYSSKGKEAKVDGKGYDKKAADNVNSYDKKPAERGNSYDKKPDKNQGNSYEKKPIENSKSYDKRPDSYQGNTYDKKPADKVNPYAKNSGNDSKKPPIYDGKAQSNREYGDKQDDWKSKNWGSRPAWVPAYFDWPPHKEYFTHHYHHANGKWVDCTENPTYSSAPTTKKCSTDERYSHLSRPDWYPAQLVWPPTTCSDNWDATSVNYKHAAALELTDNEGSFELLQTNMMGLLGACTFVVFVVGLVFARKNARLLRELKEQQAIFEDNSHYQPLL